MSTTNDTTPDQFTNLAAKAQHAQDGIGWANYENPEEFSAAVLTLARKMTLLARAVEWQEHVIAEMRERLSDSETRVNELEAAAITDYQRGI